ncbi:MULTISPECIES: DUF2617 family protein [Halorussus]|uniref:DUF2617 family protein n=1 Tax=Halorussus TaxID=1070314 RepID=UPI00209FA8CD|nr:DUF2617 family protein [Halorussus vallis]USZ78018.1 DUF2617 family protein [Halorussus vallis]
MTPDEPPAPDDVTELHFAYATDAPSLDAFDVKAVVPAELLGRPAALTVIGASHYVGVPDLGYHELCSCRPPTAAGTDADGFAGADAFATPLEVGVERKFGFETDRLRAETRADVRDIDAFPGAADADASYRFGPGAWTTIELGASRRTARPSARYETYHTYPEYGLAVYTETRLTLCAEGATSDSADERPADDPRESTDRENTPPTDTPHSHHP